MFRKLFGIKGGDKSASVEPRSAVAEARLQAIKERLPETDSAPAAPRPTKQSATDNDTLKDEAILRGVHRAEEQRPLSAAAFAGKEIVHRLLTVLKDEKGVHAETAFFVLGSLAGYACQAAVRAQHELNGAAGSSPLILASTADGQHFFFGDALNAPLAESQFSVWSLAAGAAQQAGCNPLPDISDMFAVTARTVGSEEFGKPRVPDQHRPGLTLQQSLKTIWPMMQPLVVKVCLDPAHWPIAYSLAVQELFRSNKGVLDPGIALRLVMEAAIPSSKIDLQALQ